MPEIAAWRPTRRSRGRQRLSEPPNNQGERSPLGIKIRHESDLALNRADRVRSEGGSDKMEVELEEVLAEERLGEPTNNQRERSPLGI